MQDPTSTKPDLTQRQKLFYEIVCGPYSDKVKSPHKLIKWFTSFSLEKLLYVFSFLDEN